MPKSLNEITESIWKQMSPLSQIMMNECRLTEKVVSNIDCLGGRCMNESACERKSCRPTLPIHYQQYLGDRQSCTLMILISVQKCSPEEKAIVDKCKEFLTKTATICSQLIQGKLKFDHIVITCRQIKSRGQSKRSNQQVLRSTYWETFKETRKYFSLPISIEFSFESDPEFKENRNKQFEKTNKNIQKKLKVQHAEDNEYAPVDIHKVENKKKQKCNLWLVCVYLF